MKGLFSPARFSRSSISWAVVDAVGLNAAFVMFCRGTRNHPYRDIVIIAEDTILQYQVCMDGVYLLLVNIFVLGDFRKRVLAIPASGSLAIVLCSCYRCKNCFVQGSQLFLISEFPLNANVVSMSTIKHSISLFVDSC